MRSSSPAHHCQRLAFRELSRGHCREELRDPRAHARTALTALIAALSTAETLA